MKNTTKKAIKNALATLGIDADDLGIVSLGELEKIAQAARCDLFDVMYYLRFVA